jgi:hypothetical protein
VTCHLFIKPSTSEHECNYDRDPQNTRHHFLRGSKIVNPKPSSFHYLCFHPTVFSFNFFLSHFLQFSLPSFPPASYISHFIFFYTPNVAVKWLALLLRIWNLRVQISAQRPTILTRFVVFLSPFGLYPKVGYDSLFRHPFQSFSH